MPLTVIQIVILPLFILVICDNEKTCKQVESFKLFNDLFMF